MFFKRPAHRIFDYTPRFYKPDEDPDERRKRKLGFRRQLKIMRKKKNPLLWLVLIIAVIYLYIKFFGTN
jgi:hypothetical protein